MNEKWFRSVGSFDLDIIFSYMNFVTVLSSHGDKEFVYKGITHGAVDYLLKPVRLEELKNIWQHVIRRKKWYPQDQNRSPNQDKGVMEGTSDINA